eukprot:TRINITY_DN11309_c0_g2_i2.p1 TRINITY_DN11309_c0_g2~~TRINITY_DN11309_c0_g2_i2.p1  ORF type:complete len:282 (+),score=93.27 TRINITY_DN11309_c0_g2_i2:118-963(+)
MADSVRLLRASVSHMDPLPGLLALGESSAEEAEARPQASHGGAPPPSVAAPVTSATAPLPRAATVSPQPGKKRLQPLKQRPATSAELDRRPHAPRHDDHRISTKSGRVKISGASERLVSLPARSVGSTLPDVDRGAHLKWSGQQDLNRRLYADQMERIQERQDQVEQTRRSVLRRRLQQRRLQPDEVDDLLQRLYALSGQNDRMCMAKLQQKWSAPKTSKKFTREEEQESTQRMYAERSDRRVQVRQALHQKYIGATTPTYRKLTQEQMRQSAEKLHSKPS